MVALANICSLKMAYVSRSLFMPFALSLSCLPLTLSLILSHSLAWIQCRLHISLYIPRVLCYPLTLSHMQFVWSVTSVSVTKYTHTQTNNEMKSCCWFFSNVVVADFCIFKCADLPKRMKKRTLHTKAYDFFFGQWYIFISNIASHPNINEPVCMCVRACVYACVCVPHSLYYSLRPRTLFSIEFGFISYIFFAVAGKQHSNSHTITY